MNLHDLTTTIRRSLAGLALVATGASSLVVVPDIAAAAATAQTVVTAGSNWRYNDTGTLASGWERKVFTDTTWKSGKGQLGDGDETTVVNRKAPAHPTDFFRGYFSIADRTKLTSVTLSLMADDGAVVYLNGNKVASDNMNWLGNAAASARTGSAESQYRNFSLPVSSIVDGSNTLAIAVFQTTSSDADMSFDASVVAQVSSPTTTTSTTTTSTTTSTTTTSTTTTTTPPGPDATAVVQAMLDGATSGSTVTIDRRYTIDGTLTLRKPLTLSFGPNGLLQRVSHRSGVRVAPVLVLDPAASGSQFDSLRISGPVLCDFRWPAGKSTFVAYYEPTLEAQHAVDAAAAATSSTLPLCRACTATASTSQAMPPTSLSTTPQ
jgi:hypothetical protein